MSNFNLIIMSISRVITFAIILLILNACSSNNDDKELSEKDLAYLESMHGRSYKNQCLLISLKHRIPKENVKSALDIYSQTHDRVNYVLSNFSDTISLSNLKKENKTKDLEETISMINSTTGLSEQEIALIIMDYISLNNLESE